MELKLDYDILLLAEHEPVAAYLKEEARRIWMKAAAVPNCRPVNTKVSIIPQSRDNKLDQEPFDLRHPSMFDFGLNIPDGRYQNFTDLILFEKKLMYGNILKLNEDTSKLEQEIKNADPSKVFDQSNYVTPTIASVYAEHEVYGYLQLRLIKIRDFRIKILRQLNYFRSIERRITMEISNSATIIKGQQSNNISSCFADMYNKLTKVV
jgi:hypothetical protein